MYRIVLCANKTRLSRDSPEDFWSCYPLQSVHGRVTMDFITCLPKSDSYGNVMVVANRFSKYALFMPTSQVVQPRKLPSCSLKMWWSIGAYRGILSVIEIPAFLETFGELSDILGTELHFSTSFHPQTNRQIEWINTLLECYLTHYVSADQKD